MFLQFYEPAHTDTDTDTDIYINIYMVYYTAVTMGHITSVLLYFGVSRKVCEIMYLRLLCLLHTRLLIPCFAHNSLHQIPVQGSGSE